MARVLFGVFAAEAAIDDDFTGKWVGAGVRWSGGCLVRHILFCSRDPENAASGEALLAVVADRERGANIHGALRGRGLVVILRLFVKIDVSLVVVVLQKIGSFLETHAARRARVVHI